MTVLQEAVGDVLSLQKRSRRPLAVVLAGHNGSGKSTLWYERLVDVLQIPLVNADRMMMSILPEVPKGGVLPKWASALRDKNTNWMAVAQQGVDAFVTQAMNRQVPFATETVFSHWKKRPDGSFESKIDRIREMQAAGYFVLLLFVGLSSAQVSIARVQTRVSQGGHSVDPTRLLMRFPRTQIAIRNAAPIADATVLMDNSRSAERAFTVAAIQHGPIRTYDIRKARAPIPAEIGAWLDIVAPT